MEILNLKKRAGGFIALCSLVILIILLAVLPLESGIVASADNQDIIGSGGGYGYQTLDDDIEVALIESAVLATHACSNFKEVKKQRVGY